MSATDPVSVTQPSNTWLNGLTWGTRWQTPGSAQTQIYYAEFTVPGDGYAMSAAERAAYQAVFANLESIINVRFIATSTSNADLLLSSVNSNFLGSSLGMAEPPGEWFESSIGDYQSSVYVNRDAYSGYTLSQGGFDYITWLHEIGHAMGLAHPHDNGGVSSIFPGVTGPFGSYGSFDMNQGIYTTMTYNDGWNVFSAYLPNQFGWQGTMMALDIAALQNLYGANTTFASGNNTYILGDAAAAGSAWKSIWDTGGDDIIWYGGNNAVTIDLRAATLANAAGGGGFVSYAQTSIVYSGYTIANGVTIEHAYGGGGSDTLIGNDVYNAIFGFGGGDTIYGLGGGDFIWGGAGNDQLIGGLGGDNIMGSLGNDVFYGGGGGYGYFNLYSDVNAGDFDYIADLVSGYDYVLMQAGYESAAYFYDYNGAAYCYIPLAGGGYYQFGAAGITAAQLDAATLFV